MADSFLAILFDSIYSFANTPIFLVLGNILFGLVTVWLNMTLNSAFSIIIICGMALSFFLGIVIVTIKIGNLRANRFIGLFLMGVFLLLLRGFLTNTGYYTQLPILIFFLDSIRYLYGPMILFYTYAVMYPKGRFTTRDYVHIIPFIIYLIFAIFTMASNFGHMDTYMSNWMNSSAFQSGYIMDTLMRLFFLYLLL